MALIVKDRVRETTTTAGTGTFSLAGAVTGFDAFSVVGNSNTTYYAVAHRTANEWEVGIGTYTSSGATLARTTILASSNSGSATSFAAGTKDVFCSYPSGKAVYADASGVVNISSVAITGGSVSGITDLAVADGGTGSSSASAARTALGLVIGSDVQAYDADLAAIAGLAKTDSNIIVGNGSAWVAESGATARTSLGLGSIATQAADAVNIDGGAVDAITLGTNSAVTDARIDNLKLDGNELSSTNTNGNVDLTADGTGYLVVKGNTNAGKIMLNCESNTHGVSLASPPHSAGASYNLVLPTALAAGALSTTGGGQLSTGDLAVADGGTGQGSYTNGQLLVGNTTGNTLAKATITAGSGISVTNGASAITIANTQVAGISMGKAIAAAIVFG